MRTVDARKKYRNSSIPPLYDGRRNILWNFATCTLICLLSLIMITDVTLFGVVLFVLIFILFNLIEYSFHRWLSHNKRAKKVFHRHVIEHHGFFDEKNMSSGQIPDIHVTILPTRTIVIYYIAFFIVWILPIWAILGRDEAAIASLAVGLNIFALDTFHFYYHLDDANRLSAFFNRFSYFRKLKENHRIHHDRSMMFLCNFNITHPWCDVLFGTRYKDKSL